MHAGRYWWMKVVGLCLVLAGVLWLISSLQDQSYFRSPNSPVQVLLGEPVNDDSDQPKQIPAKVQFEKPGQSPKPAK